MDRPDTVERRAAGGLSGRGMSLALAALVVLAGCGSAAPPVAPLPMPMSPSPQVSALPSPPGPTPATTEPVAPPAVTTVFTGVVSGSPGTLVRFGPGMDMPGVDIDPHGRVETFDGWVPRPDDPAQVDAVTGRVEAWSRDWFHLADGRGWVPSATIQGMQPADLAPIAWTRPASVPRPAAGLLPIAEDPQDQPVTCEIASLKMALGFRGIQVSEGSLLALIGVDARAPEVAAGGAIVRWGNPNQAFVGDPAGTMADRTGYGTYAVPIARAAAAAGATVLAAGSVPAGTVYASVMTGHPVIAWVTADYQWHQLGTWDAWDGTEVRYTMAEHAVLVIGVSPSMVVIDDPWWGQVWRGRSTFEAAYGTWGGMAVVIN